MNVVIKMKFYRILRNISIIGIIVLSLITGYVVYKEFFYEESSSTTEVKINDNISKYGYTLSNDQTDAYKTYFYELKEILNQESVDYIKYAEAISKLFVTDVFTLDNKISSGDIGGTDFIYSSFKSDFISIAKSSLYNGVKSNVYGNRNQKLPIVDSVTIVSSEKKAFTYNKTSLEDSYKVTLTITYKEDLGYQTDCTLYLTLVDDKLEVCYFK